VSAPALETIAILGTNDFHGTLDALDLKTRETDGSAPVSYRAAGVAAMAAYVAELRKEFGPSMLWLDGGDEFQGSVESNLAQGAPMVDFLNATGVNASAVGNHEFDYGPSHDPGADPQDRLGALKARFAQAHFPYLGANIRDKQTGELATQKLPGLTASRLFDTGKVKIGVLGLTTLETPRSTTELNVRPLVFADLKETTLREAAALRSQGADLVVAVAHVGLKCERGRSSSTHHVRTPSEPQGECGHNDEMVRLLRSIPAGTLDAVVAGHSHQVVHHWVAGVPVIQGGAFGRYFNVIYLNYDLESRKLLPELTRIEGPVPVCPEVFKNQGDCNGDRPTPRGGRGDKITPVFHGAKMHEDSSIKSLLGPIFERSSELKKEIVAQAARPIEHDRFHESEIGDLVTDAMRAATGAQVALMNSGGIRAPWEAGALTFEAVFRTLPFDNQVISVKVTGRELKLILRIAESGSRGFFSVSGVRLRLIPTSQEASGTDLNLDHRVDSWEANRIRGIELEDGTPIVDDKEYRLATLDFLLNGGDDLGWIMKQLPIDRQDPPTSLLRDAVIKHLKTLAASGPINSVEHPIINTANPRLKMEKTPAKGGKKRGKKRRGRAKRPTR
jgi:5'-nucleotidase